ncbi:MAG: glycoside hydrolase family 15 protein [Rhizobiales bacterium]|nr:glycoside hydrolase family 15 protein [Hyphomicrobiales bacterium]
MQSLDLGLIGNCSIGALIDREARIVWSCLPRFDGDPIFHALLGHPAGAPEAGIFSIEIENQAGTTQSYIPNTAILKTMLHGETGSIEVTDFCPRFYSRHRAFRPHMLIRRIAPIEGNPRVKIRLRPRFDYGAKAPTVTYGSNHIRFVGDNFTVRLTTDAPIDYLLEETAFKVTEPIHLILGPDETLSEGPAEVGELFLKNTTNYWLSWTHRLAVPAEWQEAVIRAAITLKMCSYEPTGAIIAAMTTSIPEAPNSARNWDYRFCWVRDAYFVVRALNSLAAVRTLENYFRWLMNIVDDVNAGHIQPVFGITLDRKLVERTIDHLPGYRGMGPVRVGNQAYEHFQHDTYGNLILAAAPAFFDARLFMSPGASDFAKLEVLGERAFQLYDKPDAGIWELRSRARVHTSSSLMCWAACDRLAKIAARFGEKQRAQFWATRAETIREAILARAWSSRRNAFVESFDGASLDASVLLMGEIGFIAPDDPRFVATVERIQEVLGTGPHLMRYEDADDFGKPETAFNICAFWYVDALARIGRREEAREKFEELLRTRNHLGLMSEDTAPLSGEPWGNFPQTYSMVGIINCAMRLSRPWESVV